jgi:tetratricopeptide (TPR) repeat protein
MKRKLQCAKVVLLGAGLCGTPWLTAQANSAPSSPSATAPNQQKPVPATGNSANPFPEDTSTVPVMPTVMTPDAGDAGSSTKSEEKALPHFYRADSDPVRSPDDPESEDVAPSEGESSSLKGLDSLLPPTDDSKPDKKRKLSIKGNKEPAHVEASAEDITVGDYYLDKKNWKAALSRFQSAMVLAPDDPEVYWGLAEAERHLGDLASARDHYLKLLDYDPDGPHGKETRKALKDPNLMSAKKTEAGAPGNAQPKQ